jgi:hypothetical protein
MRRLLADLRSQPVEKLVQAFRRFLPKPAPDDAIVIRPEEKKAA